MTADKGRTAKNDLHVTSPLRAVRFTDVAGRDCALDRLPRLPGGFLTGTFGFRSQVRGKDGFTVPPIALAWHLEGPDGDRPSIGAGSTSQPCCSTGQLHVYDFDPHSGEGSIAFRIAMLAVDGHGPFLFPGANRLAMFFGHAERMAFAFRSDVAGGRLVATRRGAHRRGTTVEARPSARRQGRAVAPGREKPRRAERVSPTEARTR